MESEPALIVILEHVGAFAVIGFLFSVTYTRTTLVCLLVLGSAVILELLQLASRCRSRCSCHRCGGEADRRGSWDNCRQNHVPSYFRGFRAGTCTRRGERDRLMSKCRCPCRFAVHRQELSRSARDSRKDQGKSPFLSDDNSSS